ncbi:MAG TPA: hydrogenase maturation nickel metallochaperone HypA [Gemmatales bacterium]|nr:hydrogenase maturation nickel metallochaperone HypA [Gemmatales bacterium]
MVEVHELGLALNLVELAEAAARQAGAERVLAVRVRCGVLSGVVPAALRAAFAQAARQTILAEARLEIDFGPLEAYCARCQCNVVLPELGEWNCPECGQPTHELRRGRELELVELEVLDAAPESGVP